MRRLPNSQAPFVFWPDAVLATTPTLTVFDPARARPTDRLEQMPTGLYLRPPAAPTLAASTLPARLPRRLWWALLPAALLAIGAAVGYIGALRLFGQ